MLTIIVVLCAGAPALYPIMIPVMDMDLLDKLTAARRARGTSAGHRHDLGRDIWSRLLYGGRTSVL